MLMGVSKMRSDSTDDSCLGGHAIHAHIFIPLHRRQCSSPIALSVDRLLTPRALLPTSDLQTVAYHAWSLTGKNSTILLANHERHNGP